MRGCCNPKASQQEPEQVGVPGICWTANVINWLIRGLGSRRTGTLAVGYERGTGSKAGWDLAISSLLILLFTQTRGVAALGCPCSCQSRITNKVVVVDGVKVKLQIWDTAGQERFRSVTHAYYRDAQALLLLYDITSKMSFDNIRVSPTVGWECFSPGLGPWVPCLAGWVFGAAESLFSL
ncbi:hypothetical protein IHE44_0006851 [Lamprotornis superbus]|uniref:Uncharacterized protein n=1 Tax=Lamprotornis superbus TaxID=245042 RepID=A0A835NHJ7_9PASS|nr:hypothetical protein IHE44_0006851 [Lamprotornis superbus]